MRRGRGGIEVYGPILPKDDDSILYWLGGLAALVIVLGILAYRVKG